MAEFDFVLFDADNTLFDFDRAEHEALKGVLAAHGYPTDQATLEVYLAANRDVAVRFMRALFKAMDYAALEENYEEVSGWVADFLALDVEDVLMQARGDADWLTGKEVLAGIEDGTVDGYYELQQEMMVASGAITEEEKCPVSDYVNYDIITEAGNY